MKLRYMRNTATLELIENRCIGCGMCGIVCPHRIFVVEEGKAVITDRDRCMECGACMKNCPVDAITVRKGVGCAYAVIRGKLRGTEPDCGCDDSPAGSDSCC